MYEKIFFVGGFHRSGSMLLASILCQNENIHMEGKSSLCQLMWDVQTSIKNSQDFLSSNNKKDFDRQLISEIPKIYYKNNKRKIVIDKNPWWTNINNIDMIKKYIDENFKMIVLYRNPVEIIKSYINIDKKNNIQTSVPAINNFPEIFYNYEDFVSLLNNNLNNNFLFIDYNDLVNNTKNKVLEIYKFLNIENFEHSFNNIQQYYLSSDSFIGIDGLYRVHNKIEKRKYSIYLDEETYKICKNMNDEIMKYKELGLC